MGPFCFPSISAGLDKFLRLKCDDVLHFFCTHIYLSSLKEQAKVIFQKIDPPVRKQEFDGPILLLSS